MRRFLIIGATLATAVVVASLVAGTSPREERREDVSSADEELRVVVTPEMRRHTTIRNVIYFGGTLWLWGALWIVLKLGWSSRLRSLADRLTRRPFVRDMLWFVMFLGVMAVLLLPLDLYAGFIVPHQFDLSNQTLTEWIVESMKALAIVAVIGSPIAAASLMLIRWKPKQWWLWLWAGTIPLGLISVLVTPLVIEPVFNEFRRLENRGLEKRLLELASTAGIEGSDVFEVDKSKQTKTMNAYVTGLGFSKRIVIWDTLLERMDDDEVVFVMAHEMGHYVRHDIWKGLAFGTSIMFGVFWLGSIVAEKGLRELSITREIESPSDPAAIPWYLLVLAVGSFLLTPVFAGYSRSVEHAADVFALETTELNEAGAKAFIKLAEGSKIDPTPHPLMKFWRYSHPPLSERIDFALHHGE